MTVLKEGAPPSASLPCSHMSMIAVGTEYQTVISFARIRSTMRGPEITVVSSTITIVAPLDKVDQMSKTDKSK